MNRAGSTGRNPLLPALATAAWIASVANWPLWRAVAALPEITGARGVLLGLGFGVIIAALIVVLTAPLAWRWSIKPVLTLWLVSAALCAHFMSSYGVVIDTTMMTNVLQTDVRETRDLINLRLCGTLVVLAGLPLWWIWRMPLRSGRGWRQPVWNLGAVVAAVAVLLAVALSLWADLASTSRNHRNLRLLINPINAFYALGALVHDAHAAAAQPLQPVGTDAHLTPPPPGAKPPLVVLVLGETARAQNFSLDGYARPTNPRLAQRDIVSFTDVTSCGTSTAASVPCMFSHLGRAGYNARSGDYESLLDVLQHAGLAVLWVDNQSGCKGVCDRVPQARAEQLAPGAPPFPAAMCTSTTECYDEALVHGLSQRLDALPAERRANGVVIVLHQMGSHGPAYASRSPAGRKPFLPECTSSALQQCEPAALINAYDNSIAYTDAVLDQTLAWLQTQEAHYAPSMLYVSDHGESLGENGLYLHGLPFALAPRQQTHVPMVMWLSAGAQAATGATLACLQGRRDAPLSHDNLFHTTLGLAGVQTGVYQPRLDALTACRPAH